MALSASTIAALARPFEGGNGPPHSTIELVWASAGAQAYLAEGNKLERVLEGLRSLEEGRRGATGHPQLPPNHTKLRMVASDLATRLLAMGLVDLADVSEAISDEDQVATADGKRRRET